MKNILLILVLSVFSLSYAQNKNTKKMEKQVYIVHGYGATPDNHWFKWLEEELKKHKIKAYRIAMPSPDNPNVDDWIATLKKQVNVTPQTVIVAHSLGTITTLDFLLESKEEPKGIVLVSGFYEPVPNLESLNPFVEKFSSFKHLPMVGKAVVISAIDDDIVPTQLSDNLSRLLNCEFIRLPQGKHFLDREGYTEFPLVRDKVLDIFKEK